MYNNPTAGISFYEYLELCRGQYELELLPEDVRYGSNYSGDCDAFV